MAESVARSGDKPPELDENAVRAWLIAHPEFFDRHPDVLEEADLQHESGHATSLIERQVEWLRAKNARLEARLSQLTDTAQDNEVRARKVMKVAQLLLRAPTLAGMVDSLRRMLREEFAIDAIFLGVLASKLRRTDIDGLTRIDAKGSVARAFDNSFRTRLIETGPLDAERARLIFPRAASLPASAAVVPIDKRETLGLLVLGADDAERFQADQGKLFLEMLAELLASSLRARLG
ncbi:DUF484 family protein [Algiphilus sp.]|uniref:DUF484 family protein n=3 Tax=Algiphilus sp. TaxID=1872431 RepID=UPI0025BA8179|nr:DUF484 family protein [Algiphilus sp.]MCK5769826.1 DUF484 family protein [Algiphilus sp.]